MTRSQDRVPRIFDCYRISHLISCTWWVLLTEYVLVALMSDMNSVDTIVLSSAVSVEGSSLRSFTSSVALSDSLPEQILDFQYFIAAADSSTCVNHVGFCLTDV